MSGILVVAITAMLAQSGEDSGLIGYWKLAGDCNDYSGANLHATNHGVDLNAEGPGGEPKTAGAFDGASNWLEVPHSSALELGARDFSVCAWVYTEEPDDVIGDLVTKYDPKTRQGLNLTILDNQYRTSAMRRNLLFGIDNGFTSSWEDCGSPAGPDKKAGVWCFSTHRGRLYAGSYVRNNGAYCPSLTIDGGHVFRYEGGTQWTDMGRVGKARNVLCMASYQGSLYAGAAFDDRGGKEPVSTVYRLDEASGNWVFCGQLGTGFRTECMVVCNGELYAGVYHSEGDGIYHYRGGETWEACGDGRGFSIVALGTYRGSLLATPTSDRVWRLASAGSWQDLGGIAGTMQVWGLTTFQGRLVCSDYPSGSAHYLDEAKGCWVSLGHIAEPAPRVPAGWLNGAEAMFVANYNGKLYSAVWPTAEVGRYDGGDSWTSMGILGRVGDGGSLRYQWIDDPPGGYWKCELADEVLPSYTHCYPGGPGVSRPSGATVYKGKLFVGVWDWEYEFKSHVYALEAGKCVTADRPFPGGWKHIAAVKGGDKLRLWVDGELQGESQSFYPGNYVLTNAESLKIGFGEHSYFKGRMCEVRLYNRGLSEADVQTLAKAKN